MKKLNKDSVIIIYSELSELLSENLSDDHKRDLKQCIDKFLVFLISKSLYNKSISDIKLVHIEEFLTDFYSNGGKGKYYYNNYKRLNILFNILVKKGHLKNNILSELEIDRKEIEYTSSNKSYFDNKTIQKIFEYLKLNDDSFYLFAVLNHYIMIKSSIIRKIKRNNFNENLSTLTIHDNGLIFSYEIPNTLNKLLKELNINEIPSDLNIFTKSNEDYSQSTFFKKWNKLQLQMFNENIIKKVGNEVEVFANSMIYEIYSKNGDVYQIQRLLNRSTTYKTKEYLKKLFGDEFDKVIKRRN